MEKIILTRGRHDQCITLEHIPDEILKRITIACHIGEGQVYADKYGDKVKEIKEYTGENVAEARHWCIMNSLSNKVFFIEDNIHFYVRGTNAEKPLQLKKLEEKNFPEDEIVKFWNKMFRRIEDKLLDTEYGIVGISAQGGNGHVKEDFQDNCRMYGAWAINVDIYKEIPEELKDVTYREDFYIMLSMLKNVYKIGCIFNYAFNKVKGIGSEGGCSTYRTQEETDKNAEWMARVFKPFVKVAIKERQWEGYKGQVKDVSIQWKKMYDYYYNKKNTDQASLF